MWRARDLRDVANAISSQASYVSHNRRPRNMEIKYASSGGGRPVDVGHVFVPRSEPANPTLNSDLTEASPSSPRGPPNLASAHNVGDAPPDPTLMRQLLREMLSPAIPWTRGAVEV